MGYICNAAYICTIGEFVGYILNTFRRGTYIHIVSNCTAYNTDWYYF